MDTDDFDRAAVKADKGERLEERDLIFLLPPDRVHHREVIGNTTAFIKGLPFDASEQLLIDVFSSFDGKLCSRRHFGMTAVRFGYGKYRLNEPVFDGMCYISFANIPRLKVFVNQFNGFYFDEKAERSGHALRVMVSDTPLDAGRSSRTRVLGGMRMDDQIDDCPNRSRQQEEYDERYMA